MLNNLVRHQWRKLFPILQKKVPTLYGTKIFSLLDKAALVFHSLYENNNYDPNYNGERWLLHRIRKLNPQIIFDVGANKGTYSQIILRECPNAQIYAFEPIPEVFTSLKNNIAGQSNIKIFKEALSDKTGEIILFYDNKNDGNTSAVRGVQDSVHSLKSYQEILCKTHRLDEFCSIHEISSIDLLKIDVEGYESNVLKGADNLIRSRKIKIIQIEYGKANLFSKYFIHDYFSDYGKDYLIGKLFPKGIKWFESYKTELDDLLGPNLILVRRNETELIKFLSINKNTINI